jgi:hypothetical protein
MFVLVLAAARAGCGDDEVATRTAAPVTAARNARREFAGQGDDGGGGEDDVMQRGVAVDTRDGASERAAPRANAVVVKDMLEVGQVAARRERCGRELGCPSARTDGSCS